MQGSQLRQTLTKQKFSTRQVVISSAAVECQPGNVQSTCTRVVSSSTNILLYRPCPELRHAHQQLTHVNAIEILYARIHGDRALGLQGLAA